MFIRKVSHCEVHIHPAHLHLSVNRNSGHMELDPIPELRPHWHSSAIGLSGISNKTQSSTCICRHRVLRDFRSSSQFRSSSHIHWHSSAAGLSEISNTRSSTAHILPWHTTALYGSFRSQPALRIFSTSSQIKVDTTGQPAWTLRASRAYLLACDMLA
jgi:hypothetical protein